MATREQGHGDLAERQAKLDSKYDIEVEQQVRVWMEMVTGEPIVPGMTSYHSENRGQSITAQ